MYHPIRDNSPIITRYKFVCLILKMVSIEARVVKSRMLQAVHEIKESIKIKIARGAEFFFFPQTTLPFPFRQNWLFTSKLRHNEIGLLFYQITSMSFWKKNNPGGGGGGGGVCKTGVKKREMV